LLGVVGGITILSSGYLLHKKIFASDDSAHSPHIVWSHSGKMDAYDTKSIRRGYTVFFKDVCSACHGMNRIAFRHLVGNGFTEGETKALAAEKETVIIDDKGKNKTRPGVLTDYIISPYANENEARYSNGGALPPDLSLIVKARDEHEDYVFSILTGYSELPFGLELREGLHFNPFFPGGAIGMAPPLSNGMVEFDDGTPATVSQMAKDVSIFLTWASIMENDEKKKMGIKTLLALSIVTCFSFYHLRFNWTMIRNRAYSYEKSKF